MTAVIRNRGNEELWKHVPNQGNSQTTQNVDIVGIQCSLGVYSRKGLYMSRAALIQQEIYREDAWRLGRK
jgi:hypothetical protein